MQCYFSQAIKNIKYLSFNTLFRIPLFLFLLFLVTFLYSEEIKDNVTVLCFSTVEILLTLFLGDLSVALISLLPLPLKLPLWVCVELEGGSRTWESCLYLCLFHKCQSHSFHPVPSTAEFILWSSKNTDRNASLVLIVPYNIVY